MSFFAVRLRWKDDSKSDVEARTPKYHDLPLAMQYGIFMQFAVEKSCTMFSIGSCSPAKWKPTIEYVIAKMDTPSEVVKMEVPPISNEVRNRFILELPRDRVVGIDGQVTFSDRTKGRSFRCTAAHLFFMVKSYMDNTHDASGVFVDLDDIRMKDKDVDENIGHKE